MEYAIKILKENLAGCKFDLRDEKKYLKDIYAELKEFPGERYYLKEKSKTLKKISIAKQKVSELKEAIKKLKN